MIEKKEIHELVGAALAEDDAFADGTTEYLEVGDRPLAARIEARARGVIAGLDLARTAFELLDPDVGFTADVSDGDRVGRGDRIVSLRGRAGAVLGAERVALNFLQRLSGIATLTAAYVHAVAGTGTRVLDTRKTTPLFRKLEKYAVRAGGGENHRFSLSDMLLVKENHFRAVGGAKKFVEILGARKPPLEIEVEVDSIDFLVELLGAPVDRIMLDNFIPAEVTRAVSIVAEFRGKNPSFCPAIEVSGGITLESVRDYAVEGVDYISVGALTHSVPALDLSLEVESDAG